MNKNHLMTMLNVSLKKINNPNYYIMKTLHLNVSLKPHKKKCNSSLFFVVLFLCSFSVQTVHSQNFQSGTYSFGSFRYFVDKFPDQVCGNTGYGVKHCLSPFSCEAEAMNAPLDLHHVVEQGVQTTFQLVRNSNAQNDVTGYEVNYTDDYGSPNENSFNITGISNIFCVAPCQNTDYITFTPPKGSAKAMLTIILYSNNTPVSKAFFPMVATGIVNNEVPILGELTTPNIPYLILQQPPGDESSATYSSGQTTCRATSTYIETSNGAGGYLSAKVGFEGSTGVIVVDASIQSTIAVTGSFSITGTQIDESTIEECVEVKQNIETNGETVFAGIGQKIKYGFYDYVQLNSSNCTVRIECGMVYLPDENSATEFIYSESFIRSDIQAQLAIADDVSNPAIMRNRAYSQAQVWQNVLDEYEKDLENAVYPKPIQFDAAAGAFGQTETVTVNASHTSSFQMAYEAGAAIDAVFEVAGNGVSFGGFFQWNKTVGSEITSTNNQTTEISFDLDDNDNYSGVIDKFDISIGTNPTYGTPIFKLNQGTETSCAYEGGLRLDQPFVFFDINNSECKNFTQGNISGTQYNIPITVRNEGSQMRSFDITIQNSNNLGLQINTQNPAAPYAQFADIGPGSSVTKTLLITKNTINDNYNDIKVLVYPRCYSGNPIDPQFEDESSICFFSVAFNGPGSFPADSDCDGVPDSIDPCPNQTSLNDDDCDTILNKDDDCPLGPNTDSDSDKILDCVDLCPDELNASLNFDPVEPDQTDWLFNPYVHVDHDAKLNFVDGDFTIEAWVKPNHDNHKTIVSKGFGASEGSATQYILRIWAEDETEYEGKLGLYLSGEWAYSQSIVRLDRWSHVAVTFDYHSQTVNFYINGILDNVVNYTNSIGYNNDSQSFFIGREGYQNNVHNSFNGSIDDIIIWDRALKIEEIKATMQAPLSGAEPDLIAYYDFNDYEPCISNVNNKILQDRGPSAFNGMLVNFDLGHSCLSNWSVTRHNDSNNDGIGDDCETLSCISFDSDLDGYSNCIDLCPNTADTAIDFDGSDDFIRISNNYLYNINNQDASFSFDILPNSNTSNQQLFFGSLGNYGIAIHNQKIQFLIGFSTLIESDPIVVPFEWNHVLVTVTHVNIGGVNYYTVGFVINNTAADGDTYSGEIPVNTIGTFLGAGWDLNGNIKYFEGKMDNFSMWDSDIFDSRLELMSAPLLGNEPGLIVHYDFNGPVPCGNTPIITINDLGPNALIGNLSNFGYNGCNSNFTIARNIDSNGDGIGDACNPSLYACSLNSTDSDGDGIQDCADLCPNDLDTSLDFFGPEGNVVEVEHDNAFNLLNANFTIEAWIYPTPANDFNAIVCKGHGRNNTTDYSFELFFSPYDYLNRRLALNIKGEIQMGKSQVPLNKWSHVAVSFNKIDTTATFYLNGKVDGPSKIYGNNLPLNNSMEPLNIGKFGVGYGGWDGRIDDVIIWNKELTGKEIIESMEIPIAPNSSLVAYYDFNDAPALVNNVGMTTLYDKGPNGLDGTLLAFELMGDESNWHSGRNFDSDGDGIGDACDSPDTCPNSIDADRDRLDDCIDECPNLRDSALDFDKEGTPDYVSVPHHPDFNLTDGDFAFEAWVNPSTPQTIKNIVSKGSGNVGNSAYLFAVWSTSRRLALYLDGANESGQWKLSNTGIPLNEWTHVAVSVDQSGTSPVATFYINGVVDATSTYAMSSLYGGDTNPFFIGVQGWEVQGNAFDGMIDEVAVWNKTLSEAEIAASMTAPYAGTESGLVAYYDFNDASACVPNSTNTTLIDKANSHNGVLTNFTLGPNCSSNWTSGQNIIACAPNLCPPVLDLSGTQSTNIEYESGDYISSDQTILSPAEVEYDAATSIDLLENFEVRLGAIFHAYIDGCGSTLRQSSESLD